MVVFRQLVYRHLYIVFLIVLCMQHHLLELFSVPMYFRGIEYVSVYRQLISVTVECFFDRYLQRNLNGIEFLVTYVIETLELVVLVMECILFYRRDVLQILVSVQFGIYVFSIEVAFPDMLVEYEVSVIGKFLFQPLCVSDEIVFPRTQGIRCVLVVVLKGYLYLSLCRKVSEKIQRL